MIYLPHAPIYHHRQVPLRSPACLRWGGADYQQRWSSGGWPVGSFAALPLNRARVWGRLTSMSRRLQERRKVEGAKGRRGHQVSRVAASKASRCLPMDCSTGRLCLGRAYRANIPAGLAFARSVALPAWNSTTTSPPRATPSHSRSGLGNVVWPFRVRWSLIITLLCFERHYFTKLSKPSDGSQRTTGLM